MSLEERARSAGTSARRSAARSRLEANAITTAAQRRQRRRGAAAAVAVVAVLVVAVVQWRSLAPDVQLAPAAPGASEQPTAAGPATRAIVRCTDTGPVVATDVVAATAAGVRVRFEHPKKGWAVGWGAASTGIEAGENTDRDGVTDLTIPVPPGGAVVQCLPYDADSGDKRWEAGFTVADPKGVWRDDALRCPGQDDDTGFSSGGGSVSEVEEYPRHKVVAAIKEQFAKPVAVEVVGYPDARTPVFHVLRDGQPFAIVHTLEGSGDTVTIDAVTQCPG